MEITLNLEDAAYLLNLRHGNLESDLQEDGKLIEDKDKIVAKLKELHDTNMNTYNSARTKAFDDGYKKAQKKVLEDRESELRTEYEVEGDTLEDIVKNIEDKARKNADLNPADVKNSDIYINDIKARNKRIEDLQKELDSEKTGREKDLVELKVDQNIEDWLKENNKVLSDQPEVKKQQIRSVKLFMKDMGVDPRPDGENLKPFKEDSPMIDEKTMKEMTMTEVVGKASLFLPDVKNGGGKSPGNRNDQGGSGGTGAFNFGHVKSEEDFNKEVARLEGKENSHDEFQALIEHGESIGL